jgi:hypothetical protein
VNAITICYFTEMGKSHCCIVCRYSGVRIGFQSDVVGDSG